MKPLLTALALAAFVAMRVCVTALSAPAEQQKQKPAAAATQPAEAPLFAGTRPDEWKSYQDMHAYILDRFVRSDGFGVSRVARVQDQPRRRLIYADATRYRVGTVQLISLGGGGAPFVYTEPFTDPSRKHLNGFKHREVDPLESDALKELMAGKEVVLTGNGPTRQLIGAVRAETSCLKCHNVKEGAMLGAFRYPLIELSKSE